MNLTDLLDMAGGKGSVGQLAGAIGLGDSQAKDLIGALSPALMRSIQKQSQEDSSRAGLESALAGGSHQRYIDQPELMQSDATREDGNRILGHIFGSKDVSRNVAAQAAEETGIDMDVIKKALPLVAGLAMGALSKKTSDTGSGGFGALLGGLLGGDDGQSGGVDDLLGLAKKFF